MNEIVYGVMYKPWPWWLGGPLIGVFVIVLILIERKQLGISSSYQFICAKVSPLKLDYFKNPQKVSWQFWFAIGLVIGGLVLYCTIPPYQVGISDGTIEVLAKLGIPEQQGYAPVELFNNSMQSSVILLSGGLLIGFGARYANGCTAGHAIMGCAQLSTASIVATVSFFVGGIIATYLILPLIL